MPSEDEDEEDDFDEENEDDEVRFFSLRSQLE